MSRSVVSRLSDEIGLSPVTSEYRFDGIQHLHFEPELSYTSFAEAVARVNANTSHGMVVWGCGRSANGHLIAAIQVFDALNEQAETKPAADDEVSWGEYGGSQESTERAEWGVITGTR